MKQVLIVGAGITGLTLGYELSKRGNDVIVVEKEDRVGGLAKSFQYNGFTFDVGPHRFFTDDPKTSVFIKHILGNEMEVISKHSGVRVFGRYHVWPLRPATLFKLPLGVMVRSGIDLLFRRPRMTCPQDNFKDYICSRYGTTLYEKFFKKYTEKFLGLPADELHCDWAKESIDKAIIDKRLAIKSLFDTFRSTIIPRQIHTEFLYPRNGMGFFCDRLAEGIRGRGGKVFTNTTVNKMTYSADRINTVSCDGKVFNPDMIVWTAPIGTVYGLLGFSELSVDYLSLVLYNVELRRPLRINYQWCYYGDEDIIFNRVSNPALFSKILVPEGRASLCAEVTCRQFDKRWEEAESFIDQVERDLIRVELIKKAQDIDRVHIERIPNAYPIYRLGYCYQIYRAIENLRKFRNLTLAGRTGLFWYNNMDACIASALDIAEKASQSCSNV